MIVGEERQTKGNGDDARTRAKAQGDRIKVFALDEHKYYPRSFYLK